MVQIVVQASGSPIVTTQVVRGRSQGFYIVLSSLADRPRRANPISNLSDGIFADSLSSEIVTPTGDVSGGYLATFQVGVSL